MLRHFWFRKREKKALHSSRRPGRVSPTRRRLALSLRLESLEERSLLTGLTWSVGVNLPSPRSEASAVVSPIDGSLLLIGGNPAANSKSVMQLAAGDDHWTSGANLDVGRVSPAVGIDFSGGVFIVGGRSGSSLLRSGVIYDAASGVTGSLPSLQFGRQQFGGIQAGNGDLYVIGGRDSDGKVVSDVEFRSLSGGDWEDGAPKLPVAEYAMATASDGGSKLYVIGGATAEGAAGISSRLFVYDTAQESWQALAPLPTPVRDAAAIYSLLGKIYVFGGVSASGAVATVQVYDVTSNQWNADASLPSPVSGESAVLDVNNMVHIIGGRNASGISTATEYVSNDITQIDLAPLFNSTPELVGEPNVAYAYQVEASGTPAPTFSLIAAPAGMTIDEATGFLQWTSSADQLGDNDVTIRASNVAGHADQSFSIRVQWTAPTIVSVPSLITNAGQPYAYQVVATGNSSPTFAVVDGPVGLTIDSATGMVQWTPTADQLGSHSITIRATNLVGVVDQNFTVSVVDHVAPTVPANVTTTPLTTSSALLQWSPSTDNVGVAGYRVYAVRHIGYRPVRTVYALVGTTTDTSFVVGVSSATAQPRYVVRAFDAAGNNSGNSSSVAPRPLIAPYLYYWSGLQTNGALGVVANHKLSAQLAVIGSPAPTLSIDSGPTNLTVSPTGLIEWTPTAADVGTAKAVIRATNSAGTTTLGVTINVAPDLPVISYSPTWPTVVGQETTVALKDLSLTASTFAISSAPDGVTLDANNTLHFTPTPDQVGKSTIVVVATNSAGSTQSIITLDAYMSAGPTNLEASGLTGKSPKLSWIAPASAVPIAGYKIVASYGAQSGRFHRTYTTIVDSPGAGTEAILTGLKVGATYSVRVYAYDAAGHTSLYSQPISVRYAPSLPMLSYVFNPDHPGGGQTLRAIVGEPIMIKLLDANPLERTYSLFSGPAGISVDPVSGAVHWTPSDADVGAANIVLRATNEVGSSDISLSIPVYFTGKAVATISDLTHAGNGVITVAPASDNGFNLDKIIGYQVTFSCRSPGRAYYWRHLQTITVAPGAATPFIVGANALVYRVTVRAIDANGNLGEPSEAIEFRLPPT